MDFYGYSLLDARSKRNNDDSHSLRDPLANPFESPSKSQILLFLTTRFAKGDFSRLPTRKFFSRADDNRNSVQIIQLDVPCSHPACFCFKRMPAAIEIFACQLPMEINVNSIIREISWKPLQPLPLSLSLSFSLSLPLSKNTNCFPSMLDLDITHLVIDISEFSRAIDRNLNDLYTACQFLQTNIIYRKEKTAEI